MPTVDIFPLSGITMDEDAWTPLAATLAGGVDRIGDGLALTAGTGLNVDITAGAAVVSGYLVSPGATTEALTASDTNYVYLNSDESFTVNVTGTQPADSVWLGIVTTDGSGVTSLRNVREVDACFRYKSANEARDSTETTVTVDGELSFSVQSGQVWEVMIVWGFLQGDSYKAKVGVTAPTNAGVYGYLRQFRHGVEGSGTGNYASDLALNGTGEQSFSPNMATSTSTDPIPGFAHFIVETNQDSGTVGFAWAHQSSPTDDATVIAGSYLVAKRINR